MRFRLVEAERAQHPVSLLCSVLGVTRAGFYAWKRRGPCARELRDRELCELIGRVFEQSRETYGVPRITPSWPTSMASMSRASASRG